MREHLVLCQIDAPSGGGPSSPSLAPRTLASYLSRSQLAGSLQISVVDLPLGRAPQQHAEQIASLEPDVVGLSMYLWNAAATRALCAVLKEVLPQVSVILGGPQLWYDPDDLARLMREVDHSVIVVRGEGELALEEYLQTPPSERPGAGTVIEGRALPDLAAIGAPILSAYPDPRPGKTMLPIETARGCRYRCTFCVMNEYGHSSRMRPIEAVRAEYDWARDHGIGFILYAEAYFNISSEITHQRVEAIHQTGMAHRALHLMCIDYFSITEEEVRALGEINAWFDIGLQTINPAALTLSKRGFHRERLEQVIAWTHKYGVGAVVDLIIGLPGESLDDFARSVDYVAGLGVLFVAHKLSVLPGSELYTKREELGLHYDEKTSKILHTKHMTASDIHRAHRMAEERMKRTFLDCCRAEMRGVTSDVDAEKIFERLFRGFTLGGKDDPRYQRLWEACR